MQLSMPQFDQSQVLVIGDVMLDRYWSGSTDRISPESPVPVVKVEQIEDRPGGAANVALNIAALGAGIRLQGLVGKDEAANSLLTRLSAAGIHCQLQSSNSPTITKLRVLSRHQQLIRLDFEEAIDASESKNLLTTFTDSIEHVSAIILSDYNKGTLADTQTFINAAKQKGHAHFS